MDKSSSIPQMKLVEKHTQPGKKRRVDFDKLERKLQAISCDTNHTLSNNHDTIAYEL